MPQSLGLLTPCRTHGALTANPTRVLRLFPHLLSAWKVPPAFPTPGAPHRPGLSLWALLTNCPRVETFSKHMNGAETNGFETSAAAAAE